MTSVEITGTCKVNSPPHKAVFCLKSVNMPLIGYLKMSDIADDYLGVVMPFFILTKADTSILLRTNHVSL